MAHDEFKVSFEHKGARHVYWISNPFVSDMSNVMHVTDERGYHCGQLIFYEREQRWRFYEKNGPDNPELAEILGNYVVLWYE